MTPVLVDSNVLLDVTTDDAVWAAWSSSMVERIADEALLVINALIYADVSIGFDTIEALELTRDAERYRSYFPTLEIIAPW